jgi:hypothetical protein
MVFFKELLTRGIYSLKGTGLFIEDNLHQASIYLVQLYLNMAIPALITWTRDAGKLSFVTSSLTLQMRVT